MSIHEQFLSIDKMIEKYTQKINKCFDKSSIQNIAVIPEELIEYINKPLIFRCE